MEGPALFRYQDGRISAELNQGHRPANNDRPERYWELAPKPRFLLPIPGVLTHLAEDPSGNVLLLFPKLGIVRLADQKFELVLEVSLDMSDGVGNEAFASYPDDLLVLPSGDFLVGTQMGLLLFRQSEGKWSSQWIHAPR